MTPPNASRNVARLEQFKGPPKRTKGVVEGMKNQIVRQPHKIQLFSAIQRNPAILRPLSFGRWCSRVAHRPSC